jgi:hypothetical protein
MLRQAPGAGTPGGEALDWALVYTPALTLTVARVDHTEKGEVVAVFTVDLRPADDLGIDTKRCVLAAHRKIRGSDRVISWRCRLILSDPVRSSENRGTRVCTLDSEREKWRERERKR